MILAIVQARMKSTRLPGKIMKTVLDKPLIELLLERLARAKMIDKIIVATSTDESNDEPTQHLEKIGFEVFRGSENNVLDRYYQVAKQMKPEGIVRITADCPLIDPHVIDECIQEFLNNECDYVSNVNPRSYPKGLDVEIFSFECLERTWREAKTDDEREHVTPFMNNTDTVTCRNIYSKDDYSKERWTCDYEEDFNFIEAVFQTLYEKKPDFSMHDILELKKHQPEIFLVNSKYTE